MCRSCPILAGKCLLAASSGVAAFTRNTMEGPGLWVTHLRSTPIPLNSCSGWLSLSSLRILSQLASNSLRDSPSPSAMDSSRRPAGREHIPIYPRGWIGVSICQLILDVIIIGFGVYNVLRPASAKSGTYTTICCVRPFSLLLPFLSHSHI